MLFHPSESVNLCQRLPQLSEGDAGRVAEAMDNLPLALSQAAAYLQETGLSADAYLQLLTQRATRDPGPGKSLDLPSAVAASLHLAFDRLAADNPAA